MVVSQLKRWPTHVTVDKSQYKSCMVTGLHTTTPVDRPMYHRSHKLRVVKWNSVHTDLILSLYSNSIANWSNHHHVIRIHSDSSIMPSWTQWPGQKGVFMPSGAKTAAYAECSKCLNLKFAVHVNYHTFRPWHGRGFIRPGWCLVLQVWLHVKFLWPTCSLCDIVFVYDIVCV